MKDKTIYRKTPGREAYIMRLLATAIIGDGVLILSEV